MPKRQNLTPHLATRALKKAAQHAVAAYAHVYTTSAFVGTNQEKVNEDTLVLPTPAYKHILLNMSLLTTSITSVFRSPGVACHLLFLLTNIV